jgi:hypothetical protein
VRLEEKLRRRLLTHGPSSTRVSTVRATVYAFPVRLFNASGKICALMVCVDDPMGLAAIRTIDLCQTWRCHRPPRNVESAELPFDREAARNHAVVRAAYGVFAQRKPMMSVRISGSA